VTFFYDMLGKFRFVVCELIVSVFLKSFVMYLSLKVAYTTNNNLGKLLEMQKAQKPNKFDKNGVYQLTCQTCHKKFVGLTG